MTKRGILITSMKKLSNSSNTSKRRENREEQIRRPKNKGHNKLAAKLNKMDKTVVPFCRHCPTEKETTEHYMARCPA